MTCFNRYRAGVRILLLLATTACASRASADVLWDNGTFTGPATTGRGLGVVSQSPNSPGVLTPRHAFADITFDQPVVVQGFRTVGYGSLTGAINNFSNIELTFYPDASGAPDLANPIGMTALVPGTALATPTGQEYPMQVVGPVMLPRLPINELSIETQDFALPAGDYWVRIGVVIQAGFQIQAGNFGQPFFGQEVWTQTGAAAPAPNPGATNFDINFKLEGVVVPEPASAGMLIVAGALLRRRRR